MADYWATTPRPLRRLGLIGGGMLLLLAVLAGIGTMSVRAASGSCETPYTILTGDTLSGIAARSSVPIGELAALNEVADWDRIAAGDTLCLDLYSTVRDAMAAVNDRIGATGCADGPQPGALALRDAVHEQYPGLADLGVYNCREARGGSAYSTHAEGRAVDYGGSCDVLEPIARDLIANAPALGLQRVVWCATEWRVDNGERVAPDRLAAWHDGRKAPSHIHAELAPAAADQLTVDYVRAVFNPPVIAPVPDPTPTTEPEPAPAPTTVPPVAAPTTVPEPSAPDTAPVDTEPVTAPTDTPPTTEPFRAPVPAIGDLLDGIPDGIEPLAGPMSQEQCLALQADVTERYATGAAYFTQAATYRANCAG